MAIGYSSQSISEQVEDAKLISKINLGTILCCDKGRACFLEVLKGDEKCRDEKWGTGPCVLGLPKASVLSW